MHQSLLKNIREREGKRVQSPKGKVSTDKMCILVHLSVMSAPAAIKQVMLF